MSQLDVVLVICDHRAPGEGECEAVTYVTRGHYAIGEALSSKGWTMLPDRDLCPRHPVCS